MRASHALIAFCVGVIPFGAAMLVGGCDSKPRPTPVAASASSTSLFNMYAARSAVPEPTVSGAPIPVRDVEAALNPRKLAPYDGPTGTIEGTVRMSGDAPSEVALKLPVACMGAEGTYGRLFREGKNRAAADVLVAVTGYEAYLPVKQEAVQVKIEKCAFSARTFTLTFGQRMEVENLDETNSFIPVLHGSRYTAFAVAVPKGRRGATEIASDPVKLYPHRVGQYELADNMNRPWMSADVFVLKYPTHAVTGVDGHFRIEGIPVGDVQVDALLPSVDASGTKKATVKAGETTKVDFVLAFDQSKYDGKTRPHPIGSISAPAASSSVPKVPLVK
jgi:hypothetical protein